ncbi:MAG TPA: FAD-binding oxidoreductase, partial [Acetobacteraceae bacterium]|nr:FAD-binding oxidoreductase [Acetobacteraceae bacterium]
MEQNARRPERLAQAEANFLEDHGTRGVCFHGAGRSYGDCATNAGGAALLTGRLDRILAWDPDTGIVRVEPGVDFRRLLSVFLPRGWMAPVTPGTGFATIGGAVANDVHGKNHEKDGTFGQHVTALELTLPDGSARTITPADEDIFRATVAGLGLTGFITAISFRMRRVPGGQAQVREQRVNDLDQFLAAMQEAVDASYTVGWIDGAARGAQLGRGILETAEPMASDYAQPPEHARAVPLDFPALALNRFSVALFNQAYFHRVPASGRMRNVPWRTFLYPLDAIHGWNRIYGRRGFVQFQCVVPFATGEAALRDLLELISASHQASFLAVLKRLGAGRAGFLSFPMPGYTLALDFPRGPDIEALYAKLCAITLDAGGRVYLAKDALLDAESFQRMYPEFP